MTITSKLHNQTVAAALLFQDKYGAKAVRIEAQDLGKEFTDHAWIGTDPEGLLYYNSRDDFEPQDERQGGKVSANYIVHRIQDGGDNYVNIKFWREGDTEAQAFAEFIGKDPANLVDAYGMGEYSSKGDWVNLDISICTAFVRKISTENKITLTIDSLDGKTAVWNDNGKLDGVAVAVNGNLSFKKYGDLKTGLYAKYNNDHIVFYNNDNVGTDFSAYFIPYDDWPKHLGIESYDTQVFSGVTWST
ncbi:hypothetical protein FB45DRAFT_935247 [Roridomyces roridus]|uniref:Uncharacterized protein n=1 Tax=Roridomyces roridus TaxID=1738132 RepID=A0AAD7FET4_9AGAR|nr:hypothetical protein FB45DRAFT_935247 [Roridomyces roridus]